MQAPSRKRSSPASRATDRDADTDGPFADNKEFFAGYFLLEADDLDAAIEMASRIPAARLGGSLEVRPVVER